MNKNSAESFCSLGKCFLHAGRTAHGNNDLIKSFGKDQGDRAAAVHTYGGFRVGNLVAQSVIRFGQS
jgi:hypothetical protein